MGFLAKLMDAHQSGGTSYNKFTLLSSDESSDATIADYVVEQGTSGDSSYRKWNSGKAECWIRTSQSVALNNAYGSVYQGTWSWDFPITFISIPAVVCSQFKWGTGASWGTISDATLTASTLRGIDTISRASGTCVISAYAIGKWK